jgi:sugar/nucleoside kinase (ribokinase family)
MEKMNFGNTIRKLRKKCGFTQTELAERLSISDKAVSKWESGSGYPDIALLPALSDTLGVTIDYLLRGNARGIVIAGNILVDILNNVDEYPKPSMLATVESYSKAVGGCVPNTIIDLSKIDRSIPLEAYGMVGNDENGSFVLSEMKKNGIDVGHVKVSDTMPTSFTNVMYDLKSHERTFFYNKGANAHLDIADIDVESLDCEIFHVGYAFLLDRLDSEDAEDGTRFAKLLRMVSERGIKTSLDAVSSDRPDYKEKLIPALKHCNYTIMNEIEACFVSGLKPYDEDGKLHVDNIRKTLELFMSYGVKEKAIIHCKEAGFLMNADGDFVVVPSLNIPRDYIKGNVGAGDAFAAGCLYGLYHGFDDEKLLRFASCASAANLSAPDSVSGMKCAADLEKIENMFERRVMS